MDSIVSTFKTPYEHAEREGGLLVDLDGDCKVSRNQTMGSLEAYPEFGYFEE